MPPPTKEDPMPTDPYRVHELSETELEQELTDRWATLLPDHPELGASLQRRYAEPQRRYHDRAHLLQVLRTVDRLAGDEDLYVVRLAAWFHDAVYDIPQRELTNEEASARLSVRELGCAGFEQEDLTQVARLVRLTADHAPGTRDPEGELLCDADLAVLASPPEAYAAYVDQVREEYAAVPEEVFLAARLEVLQPWVEGEIFRTGKGKQLTPTARSNVAAEATRIAEILGVEGWQP